MPDVALIVPTTKWNGWESCWMSWQHPEIEPCLIDNSRDNLGVLPSLQIGYVTTKAPLLAFIHDDVICKEPGWLERVRAAFDDPKVGLVGFGGATRHGDPRIYQIPYDYRQLGRDGYLSNVDDAEVHGARFTGERDVAVLDGYAMIVRRQILDAVGGWPLDTPVGYVGYDYFLSCLTHELDYRIRLVGVRCHHWGGRAAVHVKPEFRGDFEAAHRYIYDRFRRVLPWRCE